MENVHSDKAVVTLIESRDLDGLIS